MYHKPLPHHISSFTEIKGQYERSRLARVYDCYMVVLFQSLMDYIPRCDDGITMTLSLSSIVNWTRNLERKKKQTILLLYWKN
mmetsp:Transcript_19265/g.21450  ORF Transcript_19265/g.21450 Transcript_19265/m.21450 type:complete len:83 (+) Transcript_19265:5-253(+)